MGVRIRAPLAAPAALAALALIGGRAGGIPARPADPPADGFDHITHQGRVVARAVATPPCARCHRLAAGGRLAGAPGHAACFGDCHGPPPERTAAGRARAVAPDVQPVCRACHRPADIARFARGGRARIASAFPPYDLDRDFALTLSHAAHGRVDKGCSACHGPPPEPGGERLGAARARARREAAAPHARCARCHERRPAPAGVGMDRCASCHSPAIGPARAPRREPGVYPVRSRFSHRRHLARASGSPEACRACHAGAMAAAGDRVPTPRKEHCRPCHDGKRAFSMVEPACRRCHGPPEGDRAAPGLARTRFSHRVHSSARPDLRCTACHTLGPRGAPVAALRGHAPCSDAGCHAPDFAAAAPRTCGLCHVSGEPWRAQHADPARPSIETGTEFGGVFSHRAHLAGARPRVDRRCARCHRPAPDGRFRPSPGHGACAGAGCHTAGRGGAAPTLERCSECHRLGLVAARERAQARRRWSVRRRFTHAPHAAEPSAPGRAVACTDCHAGALASEQLADLPPPRKQSCARCHDGRAAFKLTGHTCDRCHTAPARTAASRP